ncbi:MAG: class I SAM-dependent methyltransferase, partial [Salinivirgaceae bacterium]|nr:class I SAM-dependent methyltransferase [Salinivirgaceae bacterium]
MQNTKIYDSRYIKLKSIDWNFTDASEDPLSNIHPYPARFIPNIPRELILALGCDKNSVILDPFCGSGTTLLEAQRAGFESVGVDLNPIACLISNVKTQRAPENFLYEANIINEQSKKAFDENVKIPAIPNLDHWFKADVQKALSVILKHIDEQSDMALKNALKLALSSIIVRVSNQESDTRYAAVDNNYTANDVFSSFLVACKKIHEALIEKSVLCESGEIINRDILSMATSDFDKPVGLVITSPPYPNAYEYWLYHKYRMWWLGFDPIQVRTFEIGARPHYQKKNGQTEEDFRKQMSGVFDLLSKILIPGGHVCFVIGRSVIKGKIVDNAELICGVAEGHNMILVANIEREIASTKKSFNLKYGKIKT